MRRSLRTIGFLLSGVIALICLALIVSQTPWFRGWARSYIVRSSDRFLNGELTIGKLEGNLFTGAALTDLAITLDGERIIYARRAEVDYNLTDLLSAGVVIDSIRLFEPEIIVRRDARGLNLGRLVKSRERDSEGRERTVSLDDIEITDGHITLHGIREVGPFVVPASFDDFDAKLVFKYQPDRSTLNLVHVSAEGRNPSLPIRQLAGTLAFGEGDMHFADLTLKTNESNIYVDGVIEDYLGTANFRLVAKGTPWSLPELEGVVPYAEPYDLHPTVDARIEGPASRLVMTIEATSEAGAASGVLIGDFVDPNRRLEGTLALRQFDLGRLYSDPDLKSNINGRARFDLALLDGDVPFAGSWRFDGPSVEMMGYRVTDVSATGRVNRRLVNITSGSGRAYGGFATAAGSVRFADDRGRGMAVDLRGRATSINLRSLPVTVPVPRLVTDLNATAYRLRYDEGGFEGEATLAPSVVEGATYAAGTTGWFSTRGGVVRYTAEGTVAHLDLMRYGRVLDLAWLADPRLEGRLHGAFDLEGRGDTIETLVLTAKGRLTDSTIFGGGLPAMTYDATILDRRLTFVADGSFRGFDGAVLTGYPAHAGLLNGTVKGRIEVADLSQDLSIDGVAFDGIASLEASTIGGVRIDTATFDGFFTGRAGDIRRFDITGPELTASASGHVDLTPQGQSKVAFTAETSDLAKIGELIGQPLSGAAAVTGTLAGNSTELRVEGTIDGSGVGYGDYRATDLDATFTAVIPDLDYTRATGSTDLTAAMIDAGALEITEAALKASYDGTDVTFAAKLREGGRDLDASGRATLHADHKEVHLSALSIAAADQRWTLEGGDAAIRYGRGDLVLTGVTLVSGASRISADGVLPLDTERAVGPLRVTVSNVDLAALEPLLMTDLGLRGTLDADAVVTGTLAAPLADGTLRLVNGAVRGYTFESLEGSIDYNARTLVVDLRLQQNPTEYLTAKGTVPVSALRRAAAGEHVEAEEQIDLRIESSPMQLSIVQAFTPYVTGVQGLMDLDVTVRGTIGDPHLIGTLGIKGGAFEVPELGTEYTGLDTRIEFQSDRALIRSFTLVDGNGNIMRVGGELAVHERQVGSFQVNIETQNFEIIDNRLGDVQITSLIALTGTLARPRLIGTVELEAARVEVDRVFDMLDTNVYALTPQQGLPAEGTTVRTREQEAAQQSAAAEAKLAQAAAAGAAAGHAPRAPLFDRLDMRLRVVVPNNLVLRGHDIRPSGPESLAIGDLNVTVGGDVDLRKAPDADTRITGVVNTVRGTYDFQGRRFEVEREGVIRFLGSADINPLIDISATRDISGVLARVTLRGTLREPTLTLTSDPPLDEADILSLIVFNRPINQVGNEERGFLTDVAANYAAGIFTEQLSQSLGRALDLDLFEIQTTTTAGEVTPRVTVGQQFGDRLFMRFSQQFGSQSISEFTLEYELTNFLRLAGSVAEGRQSAGQRLALRRVERYGLDLVFFFSY
ncbi:MAG TPA: translocation/assembly module TamB domain-containing protein [Vicinamibacterales bacterium]|nr:translocation/assembly module TamB domain-containing protein [Vicinamibacterales bacterium]